MRCHRFDLFDHINVGVRYTHFGQVLSMHGYRQTGARKRKHIPHISTKTIPSSTNKTTFKSEAFTIWHAMISGYWSLPNSLLKAPFGALNHSKQTRFYTHQEVSDYELQVMILIQQNGHEHFTYGPCILSTRSSAALLCVLCSVCLFVSFPVRWGML